MPTDTGERTSSLRIISGVPFDVSVVTIAQSPGVLRTVEPNLDPSGDFELLVDAVTEAIDGLAAMRADEGLQLSRALLGHLEQVRALKTSIAHLLPEALRERQQKLRRRVDELLQDRVVDEARMAQELALIAERADVTEEMERLDSHIVQFDRLIGHDDAVGRKMDFLIQEMNREANTMGSKCSDARVAHLVVDLKAELERMREQVQNVE